MSKVKVLAIIEFAIGTARLVDFSGLGTATVNVSDVPALSFEVTQLDTGLQHTLHLQLEGNGSSRASYDHDQLHELVVGKLTEMLRLEDVVKVYGNLKLDAPAPENYGGEHYHNRPHPLEFAARELTSRLFSESDMGSHRHNSDSSEIRHMTDGSWKLSVKLGYGLCLAGSTKVDLEEGRYQRLRQFGSGPYGARSGGKEEDYYVKGEFYLGDEKFNFAISHAEFPIARHLVFTELAHTAALKMAKEFPFLNLDAKKFTKAIVAV